MQGQLKDHPVDRPNMFARNQDRHQGKFKRSSQALVECEFLGVFHARPVFRTIIACWKGGLGRPRLEVIFPPLAIIVSRTTAKISKPAPISGMMSSDRPGFTAQMGLIRTSYQSPPHLKLPSPTVAAMVQM